MGIRMRKVGIGCVRLVLSVAVIGGLCLAAASAAPATAKAGKPAAGDWIAAMKAVPPVDYRKHLEGIMDACLEAGCVPVVSTIPPIVGKDDRVALFKAEVRELAAAKKIPLVDFHAAILERQPGTAWDGTLLGKGDVHPSGGKNLDFSKQNLAVCGYALRNYVTLAVLGDVIEKCF